MFPRAFRISFQLRKNKHVRFSQEISLFLNFIMKLFDVWKMLRFFVVVARNNSRCDLLLVTFTGISLIYLVNWRRCKFISRFLWIVYIFFYFRKNSKKIGTDKNKNNSMKKKIQFQKRRRKWKWMKIQSQNRETIKFSGSDLLCAYNA